MTDYMQMTPEQRQEWYREFQRNTQTLAEDTTVLLRKIWDAHVPERQRQESGLWNCHGWLIDALRDRKQHHTLSRPRGRRMANLRFTLEGGTVEVAERDIRLDTSNDNDPHATKEITPKYLGTMVEFALWGTSPGNNYRLLVRWLALNSELSQDGLPRDEFYLGNWRFPRHMWCDFEGNHEKARDWLSLAEQTFGI